MTAEIRELRPGDVFVFGSNMSGFHGAGAAGLACRGTAENTWRVDPWFACAQASPRGSPDRVGKWAIFGVARGLMQGREGMSYAIVTVRKAGVRRSMPLEEISKQLAELFIFARTRPELTFLMTPIGVGGAGWSNGEMAACLRSGIAIYRDAFRNEDAPPPNVKIADDIYGRATWR